MDSDNQTINKSTHEKVELWQPILKSIDGKYLAVLSDDSLDRDNEIVGKQALMKFNNEGYTVGLMDHENKILNQVCEWTNKRVEEFDGHVAFVAEPKFFESNPNARIIKGMLDEGAKMGISIGAIVKAHIMEKRGSKEYKVYTDLELLEASFVAIPSNRHGQCLAVAKMFNKKVEESIMDETEKAEFNKKFEAVNNELVEAKKLFEKEKENSAALALVNAKLEETMIIEKSKVTNAEAKIKALQDEIVSIKESPVFKALHTTPESNNGVMIKDGELPILKR